MSQMQAMELREAVGRLVQIANEIREQNIGEPGPGDTELFNRMRRPVEAVLAYFVSAPEFHEECRKLGQYIIDCHEE